MKNATIGRGCAGIDSKAGVVKVLALSVPPQPRLAVNRGQSHARLSEATLAESGMRGTAVSSAAPLLPLSRLLQMKIREKAGKHVGIETTRALQVGSIVGSAWRYAARMMVIRRRCQVGSE